MKNKPTIKAITLDLDDTLWPIWPTIKKAEEQLHLWMQEKAPASAAATNVEALRVIRNQVEKEHPERQHDVGFYRLEAIRRTLKKYGDDESLADEGFQVFYKRRQQVDLFDDVIPALKLLSQHFPLVGVTNGNANLKLIGLGAYFKANINSSQCGVNKPHEKIFKTAALALEIEDYSDILHIGDDFERDIIGAHQLGFKTAWLKRPSLNIADVPKGMPNLADYTVSDLNELCQKILLKPAI